MLKDFNSETATLERRTQHDTLPEQQFAAPLFNYMIKRENIRRRKEAGQPAPWTDDPILRDYSFTNVRRSDDRTTRQLMAHFYMPNVARSSPGDILFNCAMARWFDTADEVIAIGWHPRDKNTFTPVGPGARQGLNRLHGRDVTWRKTSTSFGIEERFLRETRALFAMRGQFLPAGFVELQLHDIQFNLCELDKYLRTVRGEGKPKRRYRG